MEQEVKDFVENITKDLIYYNFTRYSYERNGIKFSSGYCIDCNRIINGKKVNDKDRYWRINECIKYPENIKNIDKLNLWWGRIKTVINTNCKYTLEEKLKGVDTIYECLYKGNTLKDLNKITTGLIYCDKKFNIKFSIEDLLELRRTDFTIIPIVGITYEEYKYLESITVPSENGELLTYRDEKEMFILLPYFGNLTERECNDICVNHEKSFIDRKYGFRLNRSIIYEQSYLDKLGTDL